MPFHAVAFLLTTAGALSVFLSSPNQQVLAALAGRAWLRWAGIVALVAGGWLWRAGVGFSVTAAVFVTLTVTMLAWLALPYGDAGLRILRARRLARGQEQR